MREQEVFPTKLYVFISPASVVSVVDPGHSAPRSDSVEALRAPIRGLGSEFRIVNFSSLV